MSGVQVEQGQTSREKTDDPIVDPLLDGVDPVVIDRLGADNVLRIERPLIALNSLTAVAKREDPFAGDPEPAVETALREDVTELQRLQFATLDPLNLSEIESPATLPAKLAKMGRRLDDAGRQLFGEIEVTTAVSDAALIGIHGAIGKFNEQSADDLLLDEAVTKLTTYADHLESIAERTPDRNATSKLIVLSHSAGHLAELNAFVLSWAPGAVSIPGYLEQLSALYTKAEVTNNSTRKKQILDDYANVRMAGTDEVRNHPAYSSKKPWSVAGGKNETQSGHLVNIVTAVRQHGSVIHGGLVNSARWAVGVGGGQLMHTLVDSLRQLHGLAGSADMEGISDEEYTEREQELTTIEEYLQDRLQQAEALMRNNEVDLAEVGERVLAFFGEGWVKDIAAHAAGREVMAVTAEQVPVEAEADPALPNKLKLSSILLKGGSKLKRAEDAALAKRLYGMTFKVGKQEFKVDAPYAGMIVGVLTGTFSTLVDVAKKFDTVEGCNVMAMLNELHGWLQEPENVIRLGNLTTTNQAKDVKETIKQTLYPELDVVDDLPETEAPVAVATAS